MAHNLCERHPNKLARSPSALYCSLACQRQAELERAADRRATQDRVKPAQTSGPTTETSEATRPSPRVLDGLTPCHYCGMVADTVDHVRPQSLGANAGFYEKSALPPNITVPACRECNSILGPRIFRTVAQRKAAVKDTLRKKYHKYLDAPAWSDAELSRLGHALRMHVTNFQAAKDLAHARLRW